MRVIQDQGILTIRKPRGDKRASVLIAGDCCPRATGEEFVLQGKSEEILADLDGFETWSSICMKALFDK